MAASSSAAASAAPSCWAGCTVCMQLNPRRAGAPAPPMQDSNGTEADDDEPPPGFSRPAGIGAPPGLAAPKADAVDALTSTMANALVAGDEPDEPDLALKGHTGEPHSPAAWHDGCLTGLCMQRGLLCSCCGAACAPKEARRWLASTHVPKTISGGGVIGCCRPARGP